MLAKKDKSKTPSSGIATRHTAREMQTLFSGRKGRILLAEDNFTNQQVALGILRKFGLAADAVSNGVEALKNLNSMPYDLVLMDVQMPEMDGMEATRRVRDPHSNVLDHQIPIIAMTAHAMQGDREKCLEAGMDDYISKPVVPQTLAELLEKWLPPEIESEAGDLELEESPATKRSKDLVVHTEEIVPIFDRKAFLGRLMDDEDLAKEVAAGFLDDIPKQILVLKDFVEKKEVERAGDQAHKLKGASANVGGLSFSTIAFEMEKTGKDTIVQNSFPWTGE